jgi:hypothetical protein
VKISNGGECFTSSDPVYIPGSLTGIEEDPFASLKIYPNPTPGLFTLELANPYTGEVLMEIYDPSAVKIVNKVFQKGTGHFKKDIDLSQFPAGIYFLKLSLENLKVERTIVVE